mgnify:FL=1
MEINISVAKINKYASPESGDTVEVIERPNGGLSVVMADGQSSGRGAKQISNLVVRKVITLLSEGVRDGAAARAASDSLFTERKGKVSSTLNIISVDMQTSTLVITRNNPSPVVICSANQVSQLDEECNPIGLYRDTRPLISEIPLEAGLTVIMFTDGLIHAGTRYGEAMDFFTCLQVMFEDDTPAANTIADSLLAGAMQLDEGRPVDDISVVVLQVSSHEGDNVRRMTVRLPLA